MPENNQNKETYYKLNSDAIWEDAKKKESIAHHLGITSKAPVDTEHKEEAEERTKYPSGRRLRTYQGDIATIMKSKQISEAEIVMAEQKKQYADDSHKKKLDTRARNDALKNILTVCIAIGLVAVGGYSLYYILSRPDTVKSNAIDPIRPIFADEEIRVNLPSSTTRRDIISSIRGAAAKTTGVDSVITHVNLVETGVLGTSPLSTSRFFQIIDTHVPASLVRSLNSSFMVGSYKKKPFMIFTTTFFESSFASMLEWETQIQPDMGPLFITESTSPMAANKFEDSVIRNKDARVLRDEVGNVLFLYSFPDREHLLIVANEATLSEVLARLAR